MPHSEGTPFFFAPFVSSTLRVKPEWIDYNGHLNMAYYGVLFDTAFDQALAAMGLGEDYVHQRGGTTMTAEWHVVYRREVKLEDQLRVTLQLIDFDDKRLHVYMEMRHATESWLAAAAESMNLHVDMGERKVRPFPPDVLATMAIMKAAHAALPRPVLLGRVMAVPRPHAEAGQVVR
nr:thioesterase family protein [uncultured Alsobacter sp.]